MTTTATTFPYAEFFASILPEEVIDTMNDLEFDVWQAAHAERFGLTDDEWVELLNAGPSSFGLT